ncbi:WD repeat-containing protein 49 [Anabarilius grahami]|uniref:WD repeat-containing protein 49 n=1 Tax=Anabarilius grahami TaxID=495550 RepID=A0A3N0Y030_ANAGA|nr:WD repeat-containing protein 49 [Anabarilius grahami]
MDRDHSGGGGEDGGENLRQHLRTHTSIEKMVSIDDLKQIKLAYDHEFCTYVYLQYEAKEETLRRSKTAAFVLPAKVKFLKRGKPVKRIHLPSNGNVVTLREDGTVHFWTPELNLMSKKKVLPERTVIRKPKWATDFVPMPDYDKLIIGTASREIQFYELSSLEPCCQLNELETVPSNLDYCSTGSDECIIVYGDTQVKYFQSIPAIVSSSAHEDSALVIGLFHPSTYMQEQMIELPKVSEKRKSTKVPQKATREQTIFTVPKGVMTFDFCEKQNLLVTGGMDTLLRMWNRHVPKRPRGILKGHKAPVSYLCISSEEGHIYSVSKDKTAKIWHIKDETCLFTANPDASNIRGELSACLYSSAVKGLYIAADSLALLSLQTKPQPKGNQILSHEEPVLCCGYSEEFKQVVSCSQGSVVKVWDVETGAQIFEFGGAHGKSAITCMAFDSSGRRLVTGGIDGCLKMWNFNNGQCVKILKKDGKCDQICDCLYLKLHRKAFVISVGWDRRIDVYEDFKEETQMTQRPKPSWQDDERNGHRDDILCIAQCPPHHLATGSYDGEIIVWNVVSERILCRFQIAQPTPPQPSSSFSVVHSTSVLCLKFLKTRAFVPELSSAACLLTSDSTGYLHFWSVLNGGNFVTSFQAAIKKLALTSDDSVLFASDFAGFIYAFNIKQYALKPEKNPPEKVNIWRAHTNNISSLKIIDDRYVLTSSWDFSVRLWSIHGEFIGTFGQNEKWSIDTPSSWKHPSQPTLEQETKSFLKSDEATNEKSESDVLNNDSDPPMTNLEDGPSSSWWLPEPGKRQCRPKFNRRGLRDYLTFEDFNFTLPTIKKPDLSKVLSNKADD